MSTPLARNAPWYLVGSRQSGASERSGRAPVIAIMTPSTCVCPSVFEAGSVSGKHSSRAGCCRPRTSGGRSSNRGKRTVGAYSDNLQVDVTKIREYSELEQAEARRIAALLLSQSPTLSLPSTETEPVIDVETADG